MTSTASPLITSAEESLQIGSESNWDNFQFPIPDDMVIVTTDTLKFRLGTGTALFNTLSTEATIAGVKTGESNLVNTLSELQPGDNNNIITIAGGIFDASSTSPSSLSSSLTGVANVDAIQNSNLSAITSQFGTISTGINNTNINDLAILGGHQITQGENITALNYVIPINPLSITSIIAYSDKECTKPVSFFYDSTSYYIKVSASDDNVDSGLLSYTLTSNSSFITLEPLGHGLYEAIVGLVPAGSVAFTGGVEYSTGSASSTISINVSSVPPMSITSFGVFADLGCSQSVTSFNNNTTYYAQINAYGGGGSVSVDTYGLNSDNTNITITNLGNGIFSLAVGVVPTTTTTELSATASYGTFNASSSMTVDLNSWPAIIIESVSGSGSIGLFSDAACTQAVTSFNNNTTYYAKLTVLGGAGNSNTYALTSNNSYVVVTAVGAGVFSLAVGADPNPDSVLLSATVTCSNTNANTSVTATLNSWPAINISSVGVFSDSGCTQAVASFNNNTTYYAKVVATVGISI